MGGISTRTAGGSGTAVSFILTITLSTLPSQVEREPLLNKVLSLDTDKEFVIVFVDPDDISEDVEEVIDNEIVLRSASELLIFDAFVAISSIF